MSISKPQPHFGHNFTLLSPPLMDLLVFFNFEMAIHPSFGERTFR